MGSHPESPPVPLFSWKATSFSGGKSSGTFYYFQTNMAYSCFRLHFLVIGCLWKPTQDPGQSREEALGRLPQPSHLSSHSPMRDRFCSIFPSNSLFPNLPVISGSFFWQFYNCISADDNFKFHSISGMYAFNSLNSWCMPTLLQGTVLRSWRYCGKETKPWSVLMKFIIKWKRQMPIK